MPAGGLWKSRFTVQIGIPQGTSYSSLGAYPWDPAPAFGLQLGIGIPTGITIDGAHNDSVTTINVSDGTLFRAGMEFECVTTGADELFKVISVSSNALTVAARGYGSTSAEALSGGEVIVVTASRKAGTVITGSFGTTLPNGGDGIIDLSGVSWGAIQFPATWTAADLAFYGSTSREGTYVPLRGETATLLQLTTISTSVAAQMFIPSKVFAMGPFLKVRNITVGTDPTSAAVQAADRTLTFVLGE